MAPRKIPAATRAPAKGKQDKANSAERPSRREASVLKRAQPHTVMDANASLRSNEARKLATEVDHQVRELLESYSPKRKIDLQELVAKEMAAIKKVKQDASTTVVREVRDAQRFTAQIKGDFQSLLQTLQQSSKPALVQHEDE